MTQKITPVTSTPRFAFGAPASGVTISDPGGIVGGPISLEDWIALLPTLSGLWLTVVGGGKGTVNAMGTLGATQVVDLALGNKHTGTLTEDCELTTTGWENGKDCVIAVRLLEDGTGGWTPTFTGVTWIGGVTPTHDTTAGSATTYVFSSHDGGTVIEGSVWGGSAASESGGQTPTHIIAGEVFRVADRRQALFAAPIVIDAGGGTSIGSEAALIGVT